MPSNQINPFNYDIDSFDSGFLGPITDTNFRTFLFTHNLPVVNPVIGGILGGSPWVDRGTEYDVSNSNPNIVDVPNLVDVAQTPSLYNNLTNPRQVNLTSNLQNVNPEVGNILGINTPQQAGLGVDVSQQIGLTPTVNDLPSPSDVAEIPSSLNNYTPLRQDTLSKNPTLVELMTWHPDYAYWFYRENDTYNTSYGLPATLKLGFAGNTESWVADGGYVTTTHEIRDVGYFRLNNKYGPSSLVAYEAQNTAAPPGTLQPLSEILITQNTGFIQYNTAVQGDFRDQLLSRTLGVGVIPFSTIGSGINYKPDGQNISQLDEIARKRRGDELKQRIKLNFIGDTVGALNLDPVSIISGGKLINRDYTITVPKNGVSKAAQFAANLVGFNLPTSILPEGSFGWDTPTPSSFGGTDVDVFDDLLNRTGNAQKSLLYDALTLNVYGPTLESSTQAPPTKLSTILSNVLGSGQPPATKNYLSYPSTTTTDTTSTSGRKKTLIDKINDKVSQVLNTNKKQPTKPKQQADTWYPHEGGFGTNEYQPEYLTTSDDLGINDTIPEDSSTENNPIPYEPTTYLGGGVPRILSTTNENFSWKTRDTNTFKRGLLKYTQDIVNNSDIGDAGGYIGYFDSDKSKKDGTHKTGAESPDKRPNLPSKGNQVRNVRITKTDNNTKIEGGDLYCRSWTSTRKYYSSKDLIRKGGNWWRNADTEMVNDSGDSMLTLNYDKNGSGMPKIAWDTSDTEKFNALSIDRSPTADVQKIRGLAIPYMFSIENLAWKDAPQLRNLPPCEIGPNGGRIMWFPPYDINFSDSTSINWDTTNFIGRGEPIYTYNHTERSGQLSWTIVVDHPAALDQLKKDFVNNITDSVAADNVYHSFFAGCNADTIKELFRDFIPVDSKVDFKKDETAFSKVQPTAPEKPPVDSVTMYLENCITNGVREGFDYKSPKGVGRSPSIDIGLGSYEVTKACIGGNKAGALICSGRTGLNVAKLPPTDVISTPVSVLDDLNQLAQFLVTADGKNYKIKVESSTSKSNPTGPFNVTLANDRANNTIELLFNLMKFAQDNPADGTEQPPSITAANGKKYYYPKEDDLKSNEHRWERITKPQNADPATPLRDPVKGDDNPCNPNIAEGDANSQTSKLARYVKVSLEYDPTLQTQLLEQVNAELNKKFNEDQKTKNQELEEAAKKAAKYWVNECDYFQKMAEDQPFIYNTFAEKIKYFHPAFHAITPEGFNSRLTFLQQCTRQGPQVLKDDIPQNMVFGRPPICVLRIGDFYHTKIVIDSMNFTFDPLQWDLNPEGIGVQPMLAKVDMGFKFIGGSSLGGPISQLQNAVSYNFFANTSVYNPVDKLKNLMEDRAAILKQNKEKKRSDSFGVYGSFKTPQQANKYYNDLESPIQDIKTESSVDGASSDANPTAVDTNTAPIDQQTQVEINDNQQTSTNTGTQGSTQPATQSNSNNEVEFKLISSDATNESTSTTAGTYYLNIKKFGTSKYIVYEIKDNRKDCCPGVDKPNGPSISASFKDTLTFDEKIQVGDLTLDPSYSNFKDGQVTYGIKYTESNPGAWKGDLNMTITYNPGKNKTTGFQQEVTYNQKINVVN